MSQLRFYNRFHDRLEPIRPESYLVKLKADSKFFKKELLKWRPVTMESPKRQELQSVCCAYFFLSGLDTRDLTYKDAWYLALDIEEILKVTPFPTKDGVVFSINVEGIPYEISCRAFEATIIKNPNTEESRTIMDAFVGNTSEKAYFMRKLMKMFDQDYKIWNQV